MAAEAVIHEGLAPHGAFPVDHAAELTVPHEDVAFPHVPMDEGGPFHFCEDGFIRVQEGEDFGCVNAQVDVLGGSILQDVRVHMADQPVQGREAQRVPQQPEALTVNACRLTLERADLVHHMGDLVSGKLLAAAAHAASGQALHEEVIARADGAGKVGILHLRHMRQIVLTEQLHSGDLRAHEVDLVGQETGGISGGDLQHGGAVGKIHPVGGVEHAFGQLGDGAHLPVREGGGAQGAQIFRGLVILGDAHGCLLQVVMKIEYSIRRDFARRDSCQLLVILRASLDSGICAAV